MNKLILFAILSCPYLGLSQQSFSGMLDYVITNEGDFSDVFNSYTPEGYRIYLRKDDLKILIDGPDSQQNEVLYKSKSNLLYLNYINIQNSVNTQNEFSINAFEELEITEDILGYECRIYQIESSNNKGVTMNQTFWVSTSFGNPKLDSPKLPLLANFFHSKLPGIPLRVISDITFKDLSYVMTIEIIDILKIKLRSKDFKFPK